MDLISERLRRSLKAQKAIGQQECYWLQEIPALLDVEVDDVKGCITTLTTGPIIRKILKHLGLWEEDADPPVFEF